MRRIRVYLAALVALAILFCGADLYGPRTVAAQSPQPASYHILVTNDDGVRAPALAAVAQALQTLGDVSIAAPADNQTGASQSVVTRQPIFRTDVTLPNGLRAIGLTATPATAVQVAIKNIVRPRPNLVVSGINDSYNLGTSVYLGGTVGAARQAAMEGVPAIATSMATAAVPRDIPAAAQQVLLVARRVKQHGLPAQTFLNVNIPPMPDGGYRGIQVTTHALQRGGVETFAEERRPGTDTTIYWSVYSEGGTAPRGSDMWAVENGYVSVTPLKVDSSAAPLLDTLRSWFK